MGSIVAMQIHDAEGERASVDSVRLVADQGIEGDRHFGGDAADQVTLVSAEAVATFNDETDNGYAPADLGRNVVTSGVDLNALVGVRFQVGSAELEGIEPCHPCMTLGNRLAHYRMTARDVVFGLRDRGGLRARVVQSGEASLGDSVG